MEKKNTMLQSECAVYECEVRKAYAAKVEELKEQTQISDAADKELEQIKKQLEQKQKDNKNSDKINVKELEILGLVKNKRKVRELEQELKQVKTLLETSNKENTELITENEKIREDFTNFRLSIETDEVIRKRRKEFENLNRQLEEKEKKQRDINIEIEKLEALKFRDQQDINIIREEYNVLYLKAKAVNDAITQVQQESGIKSFRIKKKLGQPPNKFSFKGLFLKK